MSIRPRLESAKVYESNSGLYLYLVLAIFRANQIYGASVHVNETHLFEINCFSQKEKKNTRLRGK